MSIEMVSMVNLDSIRLIFGFYWVSKCKYWWQAGAKEHAAFQSDLVLPSRTTL